MPSPCSPRLLDMSRLRLWLLLQSSATMRLHLMCLNAGCLARLPSECQRTCPRTPKRAELSLSHEGTGSCKPKVCNTRAHGFDAAASSFFARIHLRCISFGFVFPLYYCAVKVHFTAVSNAPILRQTKFKVPGSWTMYELQASLRTQLNLSASTPLVRLALCDSKTTGLRPVRFHKENLVLTRVFFFSCVYTVPIL
jgi:Ubiquitin-like autophagy protein Apg12